MPLREKFIKECCDYFDKLPAAQNRMEKMILHLKNEIDKIHEKNIFLEQQLYNFRPPPQNVIIMGSYFKRIFFVEFYSKKHNDMQFYVNILDKLLGNCVLQELVGLVNDDSGQVQIFLTCNMCINVGLLLSNLNKKIQNDEHDVIFVVPDLDNIANLICNYYDLCHKQRCYRKCDNIEKWKRKDLFLVPVSENLGDPPELYLIKSRTEYCIGSIEP